MTRPIKRIAISTGGGDAPGLNAVIRATVSAALGRGWECVGIRDGYNGLLDPGRYPQGGARTAYTRAGAWHLAPGAPSAPRTCVRTLRAVIFSGWPSTR